MRKYWNVRSKHKMNMTTDAYAQFIEQCKTDFHRFFIANQIEHTLKKTWIFILIFGII